MKKRSFPALRHRGLVAGSLLAFTAPLAAQDAQRPAAAETVSSPAPSALDLAERNALETLSNASSGGAGQRGGGSVRLTVDDAPRRAPRVERPVGRTIRSPREDVARAEAPAVPDKQMPAATVREKEWRLSFDAGYQTRFIQHGLDIVGFNSFSLNVVPVQGPGGTPLSTGLSAKPTSSITFADAAFSYRGFTLALGGVFANSETVPLSRSLKFLVDSVNSQIATGAPIAQPRKSNYSEIQLRFDYSRPLIPGWLEGAVGYNAYFFPERAFRNTHYQGEAFARLTFTRLPLNTRVSLSYFNLHSYASLPQIQLAPGSQLSTFGNGQFLFPSNFRLQFLSEGGGTYLSGSYLELKAESIIPIHNTPNLVIGLVPSAQVSYNFGYATQGNIDPNALNNVLFRLTTSLPATPRRNEFNTFEVGLQVPIVIRKRFTVTPYFTYGVDISDSGGLANAFGSRSKPPNQNVWGGAKVAYSF